MGGEFVGMPKGGVDLLIHSLQKGKKMNTSHGTISGAAGGVPRTLQFEKHMENKDP